MTQPTFALPCEYGLTVTKTSYGATAKFTTTSGDAVPSGVVQQAAAYEIKTVPIGNDTSISLDAQLGNLQGSFFFSKFYFDNQQYKYRIVDDTWDWQVIGPNANIFTFNVERVQDPTVNFPLDYGESLSNVVTNHFFRIATTSGAAIPSATIYRQRKYPVTTKSLSKTAARALDSTLNTIGGGAFYSQVYLDSAPRRYKLENSEWSFSPEGEDAYRASFTLAEVNDTLSNDIPCSLEQQTLDRQSYGSRIKLAVASGDATPSTTPIVIDRYSISTATLIDTVANSLETSLANLAGSFFFGKFFYDSTVKKYRILEDKWTRAIVSKDENIISFSIEEVYEPTVEFAIDYGQSQEQTVTAHIFRLATASGTATPSVTSKSVKTASVRTRSMSKAAAVSIDNILTGLDGGVFYSKIYLDTVPRIYRLQPYQWNWTAEDENSYVCDFQMVTVMANDTDIPCASTLNLNRNSRVKTAQFGDGYQQSAPDGINSENYTYNIETLALSDAQALSVESQLSTLKGNTFYAKFKNDIQVYKYRLDGNSWSWASEGKDANVFSFKVKRAYDL